MIDTNNLAAGYGNHLVLSEINLHFEKGKITTIIGPNGSGKSTLMKCLARQLPYTKGDISLSGKPVESYTPKKYAQCVSYLKQTREVPLISVEHMVFHGRFPHMGFPRKYTEQDKACVKQAMHRVGIWDLRHKELPELSGGECQKVYLAMILAQEANVLLLDEPTTSLDICHQVTLLRLIKALKEEGKTIVAVLHDMNLALKISDVVCVMQKGKVAFCGSPSQLVESKMIEKVFGVEINPVIIDGNLFLNFPI